MVANLSVLKGHVAPPEMVSLSLAASANSNRHLSENVDRATCLGDLGACIDPIHRGHAHYYFSVYIFEAIALIFTDPKKKIIISNICI